MKSIAPKISKGSGCCSSQSILDNMYKQVYVCVYF